MKILLSAYACDPNRGSEHGVGWNWALQAARFHEVWVLTSASHRPAIEAEFASREHPSLQFIYYDIPKWVFVLNREVGFTHKLYYCLWQLFVLRPARSAHQVERFDITHHLTYNGIDVPGFLWLLDARFVWGPVGGGQLPPISLRHYFGNQWWRQKVRSLRKRSLRFDPVIRTAIQRSAIVVAANSDTEILLRDCGASKVIRFLEAGVPLPAVKAQSSSSGRNEFTIIWAGLLVPRKAPLLALDAFEAYLKRHSKGRLMVIGDGPLKQELASAIAERNLSDRVNLLGWLPHADMRRVYETGDVFLFTSLQDTSGNVVLEAMAQGLPVVAIGHQGALEMVDETSGVLVPVGSADEVARDLGIAMELLARDIHMRQQLAKGAVARVEKLYTWNHKGDFLRQLYDRAVCDGAE